MGQGRELGEQLRQWLNREPEALRSGRAIGNRLIDALGANELLKGPIRDLAAQPLLLQVLHGEGARQTTALASLRQQLAAVYAPVVLVELEDLLAAATGQPLTPERQPPEGEPTAAGSTSASPAPPPQDAAALSPPAPSPKPESLPRTLQPILMAVGPGLALAGAGSLVLTWLARELDRAVFNAWGWSGGVVLVLLLGLLQALSLGPLKGLRRASVMDETQALNPRQAWRWLGAAWFHRRHPEAILNLLLLLVFLGNSALPLGDVVLRYSLTALATLTPGVILAAHWRLRHHWSGAAGPISALIALAAGLSLLHWRLIDLRTPLFSVPAWVLLLVYGAVQLSWELPSSSPEGNGNPLQRALCSQWTWGLLLGLAWAAITRLQELL